jgi:tetratricopeptide (TPR) repeat protein
MKNRLRYRWLVAAALSALPVAALPMSARGQQQINATGHARDANPQIGSGGLNGSFNSMGNTAVGGTGVTGNQIVQGNVSGLAAFQGKEPIPAPGQWQGAPLAGAPLANFLRESSGVPQAYAPAPGINQTTPYYSQAQFPVAPNGYVQNNIQGGFVPAPPIMPRGAFDMRLGSPPDVPIIALPRPGELMLPGAVDPTTGAPSILVASPLMGLKQFNPGDVADQSFLAEYANVQQNTLNNMQLDPRTLERLRQELRGATVASAPGTLANGVNPFGGPISSGPMGQQPGAPELSSTVNAPPRNGALPTTNPIPSEKIANNVVRGPAAQQSGQYSQMQQLLEAFYSDPVNAQKDAVKVHNEELARSQAGTPGAVPGPTGPGPTGPGSTGPGLTPAPPAVKPAPAPETGGAKAAPLVIHTLTKDVQAKGMRDILAKAEDLMKAGKFSSAVDEYNTADQIAKGQPIDSLVWVGRANAELGAGFYSRAESQLRAAFTKDKSLMMAKYDLRTFIGEDRLKLIIMDLKDIASKDKKSPTSVFLLAYISYNMDQESQANGFLDMAEKRTDGKDPFYKLLRDHWALRAADQAPAK